MNKPTKHRQVLVNAINVAKRLRPLCDDFVKEIAESMSQVGLISPITITHPGGRVSPFLVAGAHRLAAAKLLKWETIECIEVETANEDEALLMEVDENLMRANLTPAQRAMHIMRRKEIYERLHPETKKGGAPGAGRGQGKKTANMASFQKDAAARTGTSKRQIERDNTRAKHIPKLARAVGTSLDNGSELDALAKLPPEQQDALIDRAVAGEKVSARPVTSKPPRLVASEITPEQVARIRALTDIQLQQLILEVDVNGWESAQEKLEYWTKENSACDRSSRRH
jgi:hypothetical protein